MLTFQKYSPPAFEVVERKGTGHPDTLADGISEAISRDLCRAYIEEFGEIMHHNVDKVLLIGGNTEPCFGGGRVLEPLSVVVGGRATRLNGIRMESVIRNAVSAHLSTAVKNLRDFRIEPRTREGSPELRSLIGRGANDTSIGVGFAPLSNLESLVLDLEPRIAEVPGVGEDRKIMAVRSGSNITIVVAAAMVSRYISSMAEYIEAKERVREAVLSLAKRRVCGEGDRGASGNGSDPDVYVNAADHGDNIFLTITGTSAEMGDDGATGRGNRGNGLITPMRPMTMEAIAGKNPVNHVGKIYNVMAQRAALDISKLEGVREACVTLVSRIGAPLDEPLIRAVRISGDVDESARPDIEGIIDQWLMRTDELVDDFISGRQIVF